MNYRKLPPQLPHPTHIISCSLDPSEIKDRAAGPGLQKVAKSESPKRKADLTAQKTKFNSPASA